MRHFGAAVLAASLLAGLPASAHHSIAAGFDMQSDISITGTITTMEFINPHARLFLEVEDDNGQTETWTVWFTSGNNLMRRGWRPTDLPVGETVTVTGFPARDGSPQTYGGETTLGDGRTLFGGNAPGQR
ncbi:MAG: hypothetical protein HKN84_11455 [Gammaproteobacteria bacterium]|nr:hypothetical protein [Gammaproteobacteria bacterium]